MARNRRAQSSPVPGLKVDVFSDVICPWCFLGKRRFEAALAELGIEEEVELRWRAYQLDPRAPDEPSDLRSSIEKKYGPGSFDGMVGRLGALGRPLGIEYRFDLAQRVNTFDAHRLIAWARQVDTAAESALVERLFVAYFTEGANVADHAVLAALAAESGLAPDSAAEALATSACRRDVERDLAEARERQISGVPTFVVEDRFQIPGAQETETFVALLARMRERLSAEAEGPR